MITVITPTTGKDSLLDLIRSIKSQKTDFPIEHIILWDEKKDGMFSADHSPNILEAHSNMSYRITNIEIKGQFINGVAAGSALRGIGLMAANTKYVTFADDDVTWLPYHVHSMLQEIKNHKWAFCKRRIWENENTPIGIDEFESVGEGGKCPYEMVDNNSMLFERELGTSAAVLYRETKEYNDDRLMYAFLKQYGGEPAKTNQATINQICPKKLIGFFRQNCTKES